MLYLALCAVMLMAINYVIIAFCVIKIQARLRHMYPHLSNVNRRIQTQVSHILFVQATSPLIVSIVPLGYLCYVIISGGTAFWSMIVLTMGFSWVPFTNAILTMAIVKEFRPTFRNLVKISALKTWTTGLPPSNNESDVTPAVQAQIF